jgi:thioredoxin reductase
MSMHSVEGSPGVTVLAHSKQLVFISLCGAIQIQIKNDICPLLERRRPALSKLCAGGVALDPKGFILTGTDVAIERKSLETSRPGVFAIGDVRSGSVKRVAAAV